MAGELITGAPQRRRSKGEERGFLHRRWKPIVGVGTVLFILGILYGIYLVSGLPSLEELENPKPELATRVYSIDGEIIGQFFIKNRTQISYNQLPTQLVQALIATEDRKFYRHWGIDLGRLARALVKDILALRVKEGASTITQQVARNLYLTQETSLTRKIREAITAVQIERTYTKQEIVEMYFNVNWFGRSAYGVVAAAQVYFHKEPKELTLEEAATLVGIVRGPAVYDPFTHPDRALARRNLVLRVMRDEGFINEQQFAFAKAKPLKLATREEEAITGIAPHFVEYIRQQMQRKAEKYGFDIYRDGLAVYTTLDSRMQRHANDAVAAHLQIYQPMFDKQWNWKRHQDILWKGVDRAIRDLEQYRALGSQESRDSLYRVLRSRPVFVDSVQKSLSKIQVGFIAVDPKTGGIRAMVGGSNYREFRYGLNHVTQIKRQPGSAFKPFVYTAVIDNGYPPCYELLNQPVTVILADGSRWTPQNFGGSVGGKYTLREAVKYSVNLITIRAIMELAPPRQVVEYAHRMGIKSELPPYESLALGTGEVTPLELTSAFAVFADEGVYVEPISILRIEDRNGNTIEQTNPDRREVLSKETAYIMTSMLEGAVNEGTGSHVRQFFHLPAAGKTGTTQEYADAWFVGFTPGLAAGIWVGFDDHRVHFTNTDGQGGRAAAPIFGRFMQGVYDDREIAMPLAYFEQPEGVVTKTICALTKKIATPYCPETATEIFNDKFPWPSCDVHVGPESRRVRDKGALHF